MTYHIKGGSKYNEANPKVWVGLFLGGFLDSDYLNANWKDIDYDLGSPTGVAITNQDPFWRMGGSAGGAKELEIGLYNDFRIKFETTGIKYWDGDSWEDLLAEGGASSLNELGDVVIDAPADNELLAWDNGTTKWINQTPAEAGLAVTGHNHNLNDLAEKDHSSLADVTANQHHTKAVSGDINLNDLAEKSHDNLDDVSTSDHHVKTVKYTNGEVDTRIGLANHDVLQNPNGNAEEQHLTSAQITALHAKYTDAEAVQAVEDTGLVLSATKVITSADENLTFTFGRNTLSSPTNNYMYLSHRSMANSTDYAIRQNSVGETRINSRTGQPLSFCIAGNIKMGLAAALTMSVPIAMGANDITLGAGQTVDTVDVSAFKTAFDALDYYTQAQINAMNLITQEEAHAYIEANALTLTADVTFNAGQLFDGEDVSALGDHLDQDVKIASTPTFSGLNITNALTLGGNITIGGTVDGVDIAARDHARYTDDEAVSAMGAKGDGNPLHHDIAVPRTNLTQLATRNHNDLLNIDAGDIKHITAALFGALHAVLGVGDTPTFDGLNLTNALTLGGNISVGGTVDGVNVGALKTAHDAISITNMPTAVNNWKVYCTNGAGVMTEIATGAAATVLTGNGVGAAPSFQAAGGGGGENLEETFQIGKIISGANSLANAFQVGEATDRLKIWHDGSAPYIDFGAGNVVFNCVGGFYNFRYNGANMYYLGTSKIAVYTNKTRNIGSNTYAFNDIYGDNFINKGAKHIEKGDIYDRYKAMEFKAHPTAKTSVGDAEIDNEYLLPEMTGKNRHIKQYKIRFIDKVAEKRKISVEEAEIICKSYKKEEDVPKDIQEFYYENPDDMIEQDYGTSVNQWVVVNSMIIKELQERNEDLENRIKKLEEK